MMHCIPARFVFAFAVMIAWMCAGTSVQSVSGQDQADPTKTETTPSQQATGNEQSQEQTGGEGSDEPEPEAEPGNDDEILAGHSYHGQAFNEGPRQAAYIMGTTGPVDFPVTTCCEEAQAYINQGIGQLHGFWYLEAERSFRQAAKLDPQCPMAYWGCALANRNNEERAKGFMEEAMKYHDKVTRREQMYLDALDKYLRIEAKEKKKRAESYTKSLEDIAMEFPDDLEAKAFLAVQIWFNRSSDLPIGSYLAADALMKQIFEAEPMHPTHHYVIHLWDYRNPSMALESAAKCGPAAPGIAHMWHMPGHIYSRLQRYDDACYMQEASARVDHAHMMRDRVMPDEIHNFAHNNEWFIRNLIHVGRVTDALDLAKNMTELPRHPRYNTFKKRGGSASYGRSRLFDVLINYQLWDDAIQLAHSPYLEPTDDEVRQRKRLGLLGAAYFMTRRNELGNRMIADLQTEIDQLTQSIEGKVAEARKQAQEDEKNEEEIEKAGEKAKEEVEDEVKKIAKVKDLLEGFRLLSVDDPAAALEKLKSGGYSDKGFLAEVRFRAGEVEEALKESAGLADRGKGEVIPLARLCYLQAEAEKWDEAKATFDRLREISSSIDLQSHLFERLAPIASRFEYPADWRVKATLADDLGDRPPLDELGPFRWAPGPAPEWQLPTADGLTRSSKEFQGKPVILIFYLGYGCLHCAEQLHAFAPQMQAFEEAGISMLAVSTDPVIDLKRSIEDYEGGLPIPLVSDASHDVFRAFRAYDDFEAQALHGTFLIDENGLIRWQDISYEPFMDHEFLLNEAQRLLAQEPPALQTVSQPQLQTVNAPSSTSGE